MINNTDSIYEIHSTCMERKDECLRHIATISDIVERSDLYKIFNNVSVAFKNLDVEFIECKKRNKLTIKYQELEQKFDEVANIFGQYVTLSLLSRP